jgi:hypothetical protein
MKRNRIGPGSDDPAERAWLTETHHYLRFGFRAKPGRKKGRHWAGGPARHKGAHCPVCRRPWLLLWDIDCTDPIFQRESRRVFPGIKRLPLYYCWTCSTWMAYEVVDDKTVRLIARDRGARFLKDWPYENYPLAFERRPLVLERLPDDIEKIVAIGQELGREWITERDWDRYTDWTGYEESTFNRQQLGGLPYLAQDDVGVECPRRGCRWQKNFTGYVGGTMKVLASVHHDSRWLPMIEPPSRSIGNEFVQVVFRICPGCSAIRVEQMCD